METLTFDSGLVTYNINDKAQVTFNPTDSSFAERLYSAFEILDKKQDEYKAEIKEKTGTREVFTIARKMDTEMREIIDSVFEKKLCDELFGDMNVYALASGLPVWANLLLAVIDKTNASMDEESKKTDDRLNKYLKKYGKHIDSAKR